MSLTNAMLVGFTGIQSNSVAVDTVGDNLANLNTTAFKGQRTLFETLLYHTIDEGEGPSATSGGTLPRQIGNGVTVGAVQRNFEQGAVESTGFQSDLAVEGDGFFIVDQPGTAGQAYTRDGSFHLDESQTVVNSNGASLQVFPADPTGAIDPGNLSSLVVPLGTADEAIATTRVEMDGRLDAGANVAGTGAVAVSDPLVTSSGTPATGATALTDLVNGAGLPLFATGDELRLRAAKGGLSVPESTFIVGTTGSTVGDLADHLEAWLGIDTQETSNGAPGVRVSVGPEPEAGTLVIESNPGEVNAIALDVGSIVNVTGIVTSPFSFETQTSAVGEGVTTSFGVYDSLGHPLEVRLRMSLESKTEGGTTWRFLAESVDDSDPSPFLGTGAVNFDPNGQFISAAGVDLTIDRTDSGAATPLTFTLDFSRLTGLASADGTSQLIMASQDGAPSGVMTGYAVDADGIVTGTFSNQRTRVLGQIALATFTNNEGLLALSDNLFVPGPNSGNPAVTAPQTGLAGSIVSGALEAGNVEIAREFINLITASTGISAASRVVRAADDLLQELLLLAR